MSYKPVKNNKVKLTATVLRITFHNSSNGWSVLKVNPCDKPHSLETVILYEIEVFAGAKMEFYGEWSIHHKYGRQFKATEAIEKTPSTITAIEKYLGSGLIKGIGSKTAKKIVEYFGKETLYILENNINRLTDIPGIASKKLDIISKAWIEHKNIRTVVMFLQKHGISTLFAIRIYKKYGNEAVTIIKNNPYRLVNDFYGIGFLSADKIALSIGLAKDSEKRIIAGISHVLMYSQKQGHCYLLFDQIYTELKNIIDINMSKVLEYYLKLMELKGDIKVRILPNELGTLQKCYYSRSLYYDENTVAFKLKQFKGKVNIDFNRTSKWIQRYCQIKNIKLSDEQIVAIKSIIQYRFSILTGGPGCGKTTSTLIIVRLLETMGKNVQLAAPTGRAAHRISEIVGRKAKTVHRLLKWESGNFKKNESNNIESDFLIIDECSMLDIRLSASLFKAIPRTCQVLLIGDVDQLPPVGAGNILKDLILSRVFPIFELTHVFRQLQGSLITKYAHQINKGKIPKIDSPFNKPNIWRDKHECIFIDSNEATNEQIHFINKVKTFEKNNYEPKFKKSRINHEYDFKVPKKFDYVNLSKIIQAKNRIEKLKAISKKIHPWSSLHYGLSAIDTVTQLYIKWIPKYQGTESEVQILSPMSCGLLGTNNLNSVIQLAVNPANDKKSEINIGGRIFREGDRVIHCRNNYNLNVYNGDIGKIKLIESNNYSMVVTFFPDNREVYYEKDDILELALAYAITIHKSQGSEFATIIIPILTHHFRMLYRNLIYTGLTRAKKLAVFVGTRNALAMAVKKQDNNQRQTALKEILF